MSENSTIIAIGNEILQGHTENSNSSYIAQELVFLGANIVSHRVISDLKEDIHTTIHEELSKERTVITTGGLGPTVDDLTKDVLKNLFNDKQAIELPNSVGTAPGLFFEDQQLFPNARLFALPGPPIEMKDVFQSVRPYFLENALPSRTIRLLNTREVEVNNVIKHILATWPSIQVGIYPSFSLVRVYLSASSTILEKATDFLISHFPDRLLETTSLEEEVHSLLLKKGWHIATAESCTAGALSARIASVPCSSDTFLGSAVTYTNEIKRSLLTIPISVLKHGAVTIETTFSMAQGAQALFNSDVTCAVSGFFGPTGDSVGTVCMTLLLPATTVHKTFSFHGSREAICEQTIQAILCEIIMALNKTVI